MRLLRWNRQYDLAGLHTSLHQSLDTAEGIQGSAVDHTILDFLFIGQHIDQAATDSQVVIKVRVVDTQYLIATRQCSRSSDATWCVAKRIESLVLYAHAENKRVVRDDCVIVQNHILIATIKIDHARVDHVHTILQHQLIELSGRITSRIRLQIWIWFLVLSVGNATWRDQNNARKVNVVDGKQCFYERDASITCSDNDYPWVLDDLRIRQHPPRREAERVVRLSFIQRIFHAPIGVRFDLLLLLLQRVLRLKPLVVPFSFQKMWESSGSYVDQAVEYWRYDRLRLYFKIEACLLCQSKHFFKYKPCSPFENWIYAGVDESCVTFSFLFRY